jgi:hypothetical protein
MAVSTKIVHRRDTAANWTSTNPTLANGEIGFETDTLKFKVGNGSTAWTSLKYSQDASLLTGNASITTLTTTGNINTSGKIFVTASSGDEGGEIYLANAATNTTINGGVNIDIYQNKLRFWEAGGSARGYYIDITNGGAGVSTNLAGGSTGAMNYAQTIGTKQSAISSAGTTVVSVSIATNGYPIQVTVTGDVENSTAGGWVVLQLYRGATAIGNPVHAESSAGSENVPYALSVIDAPSAGTYTYALKLNNSAGGTFNFGESNGPVITAIELSGPKGDTGAAGPTFNGGTITNALAVSNTINTTGQFTSTFAGAPFVVSNTTVVTNLNADLLDGYNTSTSNAANTVVVRDASGNFAANQATLVTQKFGTGIGAPSFDAYNAGVRVILYDNIGATSAGYAIGINAGEFWHTLSDTTGSFKWYGGTTPAGTLTGTGAFTAVANVSAPTLISTVANGTAPFTVTSTTQVANLNVATSGTTSNVLGGDAGSLPYQSAANTTTYLARTATNNSTLAFNSSTNAPFWVTPTLSNTYYAATTSAQLAGVISDETGTGNLVFNTSPTIVTPSITTSITTTTSSTFSLINTTASTINFGGAATVMNIGSTVPGSYIDVGYDFIVSNNLTVNGSSTLTSATFGGGYGNTGTTISTAGVIETNGALTADGTVTGGNLTTGGSLTRTALATGNTTTASINGTGQFIRTTSSERYKQDIEDANFIYEDVLSLLPKTFRLKEEAESNPNSKIYGGLIAEDVDQIESLKVFVNYMTQEDGSVVPDGIAYGEMVAALVSALKHQNSIIENLTSRVEFLENN